MAVTVSRLNAEIDFEVTLCLYQGASDYLVATGSGQPSREMVLADSRAVPPGLPADAKHYGLIKAAQEPVGVLDYLVGYPDGQTLFIGLLLIPQQFRRQGYGAAAVDYLRAHYPNHSRFRVGVFADNHAALAFWQAQGFVEVAQRRSSSVGASGQQVCVLDWARTT